MIDFKHFENKINVDFNMNIHVLLYDVFIMFSSRT